MKKILSLSVCLLGLVHAHISFAKAYTAEQLVGTWKCASSTKDKRMKMHGKHNFIVESDGTFSKETSATMRFNKKLQAKGVPAKMMLKYTSTGTWAIADNKLTSQVTEKSLTSVRPKNSRFAEAIKKSFKRPETEEVATIKRLDNSSLIYVGKSDAFYQCIKQN